MTWTITNWANADWSAAAILNEFINAINERASAAGGGVSSAAAVAVGDDVQRVEFFRNLQTWIESYLGAFVVSHVAGVPRSSGCFDNTASIDSYANLAAVFSAAGLEYSNWRRYTTHPDEGGGVAYGQMQAGDIIGPWIFEDLQKCLNVLVWTKIGCDITGGDSYEGRGSDTDWATAKAIAEAAWARTGDGNWPHTYSTAWTFGSKYYAVLSRRTGHFSASVWNGVNRSADFYIKATKPTVFDAYGDDVIEDKWSFWLADEPANEETTIVSSSQFGDASVMPNNPWCDKPPPENTRGWDSSGGMWMVLRWNVAGGFSYQ